MIDPLIQKGVAFVTGAGSGIGQCISKGFAETGCEKFFLVDLNSKGLEQTSELIQKINPNAIVTLKTGDISKESIVKDLVEECVSTFGRIDFACNNAGIAMPIKSTADVELDLFEKVHNVNFRGVFYCQKYELAAMLKQEPLPGLTRAARGSIVNTASLAGISTIGGISAYHSSKHGVVSMTRVGAREYGKEGIRINCICPGFVRTDLGKDFIGQEFYDMFPSQCPMERIIEPEEIADGVMFLHGSLASAVTGIALPVDGGAQLFHTI